MLDMLGQYLPVIAALVFLLLFIRSSALSIKKSRKKLDEKNLSDSSKTHTIWIIFAHNLVIIWMVMMILFLLHLVIRSVTE